MCKKRQSHLFNLIDEPSQEICEVDHGKQVDEQVDQVLNVVETAMRPFDIPKTKFALTVCRVGYNILRSVFFKHRNQQQVFLCVIRVLFKGE